MADNNTTQIMQRRDFLQNVAAISAMSLCGITWGAAKKEAKPDILLIMPDQMRGDCLSCLNHPVVETPVLDALAKQGTLFRRGYATVASCIPARYALLTGLYPQTSGVVGFKAKPITTPTLPELLRDSGYSTVLVGRNMHQTPANNPYGYDQRKLGSTYVSDDHYDTFLKKASPDCGGIQKVVSKTGVTYNWWQANPWPLDDALHPTAWVCSESKKIVKETAPDQPLFLTTSFYAPHPPLFPPKKYFDCYLNKELPTSSKGDWVNWDTITEDGDKEGHRVLLKGDRLKRAQAGYFGLIEHIDDQIASLVMAFKKRSEQAGHPWLIVVTSDHGEMLADHGYFRKCEPYEGSANIPFIITGSQDLGFQQGQINKQPVCLEDIMPTLLAAAGVHCPEIVDGVNLIPTLKGSNQTIRPWLHIEHAPCYSEAQAYHALTDGYYKYIWRPSDGTEQLFDLDADIKEEHNLATVGSSKAVLKQWRTRLIKRLADRPEGFSDGQRLIAGKEYRPQNKGILE